MCELPFFVVAALILWFSVARASAWYSTGRELGHGDIMGIPSGGFASQFFADASRCAMRLEWRRIGRRSNQRRLLRRRASF